MTLSPLKSFLACYAWVLAISVLAIAPSQGQDDEVDYPPLLDSSDVAYFFERDDLDSLHQALTAVFARSERQVRDTPQVPLPQQLVSRGGGNTYTTANKLEMDLEQAEYLAQKFPVGNLFERVVVPTYRGMLERIPPLDQLKRSHGLYAFRKEDHELFPALRLIYNRALHVPDVEPPVDPKTGKRIPIINPHLDIPKLQQQWNKNGVIAVDNILTPEGLAQIRRALLESTVWYEAKMPLLFGGYAGAYIDDGLHDRVLLELSKELASTFDTIIGQRHALKYLWAYKYDSDSTGINLHADQAAVNVNIWLTPDEANLDPNSGGLVVYTAKPPPDWDFAQFNTDTDRVRDELLRPTNFANLTVPHRQNRAVIFDSALFHQTDHYKFRKGYENRRINLTLLYGDMQTQAKGQGAKEEL